MLNTLKQDRAPDLVFHRPTPSGEADVPQVPVEPTAAADSDTQALNFHKKVDLLCKSTFFSLQ